jgi:hypothetical protein
MDSFGLGSLAGSMLTGVSLACCFYGYTPDQQTQFLKDVAQNRGVRVEFFDNREAALRWLGWVRGTQFKPAVRGWRARNMSVMLGPALLPGRVRRRSSTGPDLRRHAQVPASSTSRPSSTAR